VGTDSNLATSRRKALAGTSGWVRCDRSNAMRSADASVGWPYSKSQNFRNRSFCFIGRIVS